MTAIAYKDGTLACDTLVTEDGGYIRAGYVSKIARSPGNIAGGAAGRMSAMMTFLDFISSGRVDTWAEGGFKDKIDFGGDVDSFEGLLVMPDGEAIVIDSTGHAIRGLKKPFYALGSINLLSGAMAAGASAVEAVKIAIALATYCGGDINAMQLGLPENIPESGAEEAPDEELRGSDPK